MTTPRTARRVGWKRALVTVALVFAIWAGSAAFWKNPAPTSCADLPPHATVLVPGFWHAGRVEDDISPGPANMRLARLLNRCADRIDLVLTQLAVSEALPDARHLRNGAPVEQMHADNPNANVRTYAALKAAVDRLGSVPDTIVLLAHPSHLQRARMDLANVFHGRIVLWHTGDIGYHGDSLCAPVQWAGWNTFAWAYDGGTILSARFPWVDRLQRSVGLFQTEVPASVRLDRIRTK